MKIENYVFWKTKFSQNNFAKCCRKFWIIIIGGSLSYLNTEYATFRLDRFVKDSQQCFVSKRSNVS